VLSWRAIEELVTEEVATVTQLKAGRSVRSVSHALLTRLRADLTRRKHSQPWLMLSSSEARSFPSRCVPWSQPTEGLVHLMLPALRAVLDSAAKAPTNPHVTSSKDKRTSLIGSLFVPIIIEFGNELEKQNLLAQRSILDILMVTFFKVRDVPASTRNS
jgi:hypothetical protein